MPFKVTPQLKVGLFVLLVLLTLGYVTLRISQHSILPGGTYPVYVLIDSASGITAKTPVQVAGIQVGVVDDIELIEHNRARLKLSVSKKVKLSRDVRAQIKSLGFLGDTYIELYQPGPLAEILPEGSTIIQVQNYGDFSSVTGQISAIAEDVKAITTTMRTLMSGEDSAFARSIKNIEKITDSINRVTVANEGNLNAIIANLRAISDNLNGVVSRNVPNVDAALGDLSDITAKVKRGEGTIGRLLYDDETVEKLNSSIDNLNELLGGANRLQVDMGYHTEYLGTTEEFKHYVSLGLKPRPDKAFLFEFVDDPAPDSSRKRRVTDITSGGVTTTVEENIETTEFDKFRFSAQFAKKFYGLTVRGGLIESTGGVGLDYTQGPAGIKFSAFDFETKNGERPHLKAMGTLNVTRNLYLLGGLDDFISQEQETDWFLGAGLQMTDDDLKSLLGLMSVKP